ncbi:FAD-dependent monooxygenase [Sphaerisporangium sp. NBC_01403]|uniref:FAD-dependent monooxygenase n=1 Tax=Sphaerisporangium sp. NBC_01403 TaxID=2903599 RepID=UPI00325032BF
MEETTLPVLIAGAGLAGLSTAMFLGVHGVRSLVVERHPGLSTQPKARGQMPSTMEALATAGVAERFVRAAPLGRGENKIVIAESVTGPVLHNFVRKMPDLSMFSPVPMASTSQERAERILAARAIELGADIAFSTELERFHQDDDQVTAVLRDTVTGERRTLTARYLVGADGHKGPARDMAGIATHGRSWHDTAPSDRSGLPDPHGPDRAADPGDRPARTLFLQFESDLEVALNGSAFGLFYLQNPALPGGSATIVTTDHPGRYVLSCALASGGEPGAERLTELIRTACGIPDLDVKILDAAWSSTGDHITRVADTFQAGRLFLTGDAAHLMPPTGGQGGNTAVLDGYHLAWKLAAVLGGTAGPALLTSHDAERRPFADALAEQQYANMVQRQAPHLHDETVAEIMDPAVGLFGYVCPSGAFVPEERADAPALFEHPAAPSGRPGSRAPHIRLTRAGAPISTRDLFGPRFVLLTGPDGGPWAEAAGDAARNLGLTLDLHAIGGSSDLADPDGRFPSAYGVTPTGAVLVRPDGVIAWRSPDGTAPQDLEHALRRVLHRN